MSSNRDWNQILLLPHIGIGENSSDSATVVCMHIDLHNICRLVHIDIDTWSVNHK